jgi:hypothetical protein
MAGFTLQYTSLKIYISTQENIMELILAALINIGMETKGHYDDRVAFENRVHKCVVNETCRIVEKDGYSVVEEIEGAEPTDRFKCVREKTCNARWEKGTWYFDPIASR